MDKKVKVIMFSLILEIKACFGKLRIVLRCANIQTFTNK